MVRIRVSQNVCGYLTVFVKQLLEQLGQHHYPISTHPDELVPAPSLKISWIRL